MSWTTLIIAIAVLVMGHFTGVMRPTGLLSRTHSGLIDKEQLRALLPLFLTLAGLGLFATFGYNGIWYRLQTELEGKIISRQDLPQTVHTHEPTSVYKVRRSDSSIQEYTATRNDPSLPQTIPVGAYIAKRQWELSYSLNGQRVDEFPLTSYVLFLLTGLACLIGAAFSALHFSRKPVPD